MAPEEAPDPGVLHFLCGRAGAGKSTLARQIARATRAVLICEEFTIVEHVATG